MLTCRCKRLDDRAKLPVKAHPGDVCFDLASCEDYTIEPGRTAVVQTGLAIEPPPGYAAQIHGRSSQSRAGIRVSTGVIDSGFRGPIGVVITNHSPHLYQVTAGMRIAQLEFVFFPPVVMV
jgi:dUTP pyrophosphatase